MPMKINKLEIENVKRVKAVKIEPNQNGLTIIGGKNNQGKTSVLDSIASVSYTHLDVYKRQDYIVDPILYIRNHVFADNQLFS